MPIINVNYPTFWIKRDNPFEVTQYPANLTDWKAIQVESLDVLPTPLGDEILYKYTIDKGALLTKEQLLNL